MRWQSPTDGGSFVTSVTYSLRGAPTRAVYTADPSPGCSGWSLDVEGASVSGTLSAGPAATGSEVLTEFLGYPSTPFGGSYDINGAKQKFTDSIVSLTAPIGPGDGYLVVAGRELGRFIIASWTNPSPVRTGSGGNNSYGGNFGLPGEAAGEGGSGGISGTGHSGGTSGAGSAVPIAGAAAGGARDGAGNGGSN